LRDLYEATDAIVGQDRARRQLAVLLDRQRAVAAGRFSRSAGAIVGGQTGTGKTHLVRMMASSCGLPFAEVNATQYTESGYTGLDLKQAFLPLIEAAAHQYDGRRSSAPHRVESARKEPSVLRRRSDELKEIIRLAETGVLFVDEFDKWMHRRNHVTGQLDTAVQAEFLKMVEGSIEFVSDSDDEVGVPFDTSRVLFVCAGAFVGLVDIVLRRLERSREYVQDPAFWQLIEPRDFVAYGVIPELAGRLSTHIFLYPLREDHLVEILRDKAEEYRTRFEDYGCAWGVDDLGLRQIARLALELQVGARGLDHVMWQVFSEALFEAADEAGGVVQFGINQKRAMICRTL
jgi:ATP-dependent Clp protease ATP-binding subunit ClpX